MFQLTYKNENNLNLLARRQHFPAPNILLLTDMPSFFLSNVDAENGAKKMAYGKDQLTAQSVKRSFKSEEQNMKN